MLWDDFLNSDYHDWKGGGRSEDRLDKPGWRARWLADHQLPDPGAPSAEEMENMKRLRARMLQMVQKLVAGESVDPSNMEMLNLTLAEGPAIRRIVDTDSGFRLEFAPLHADWPGIQAEIAASFGRVLAEGEYARLRICENPDCLWVYYDETRNRSKRFCDDKMCGNLMKVRRFRARQKAAENGGSSNRNA